MQKYKEEEDGNVVVMDTKIKVHNGGEYRQFLKIMQKLLLRWTITIHNQIQQQEMYPIFLHEYMCSVCCNTVRGYWRIFAGQGNKENFCKNLSRTLSSTEGGRNIGKNDQEIEFRHEKNWDCLYSAGVEMV